MNYVVVISTNSWQSIKKITLVPGESLIIGRAWQSDVIVQDEYVDASHVKLDLFGDGELRVEDLGSKNGTRLGGSVVDKSIAYLEGSVMTLGETSLAIYRADSDVAVARGRDAVNSINRSFGGYIWVLVATILASLAVLLKLYLITVSEVDSELLATAFLGVGAMCCSWCLIAGLVSKLFRGEIYGKLHWIFVASMYFGFVVLTIATDVLMFNLDSAKAYKILSSGVVSVTLGLFLYGALSLCTRLIWQGKLSVVSIVLALFLSIQHVMPMLSDKHEVWSSNANLERVNLPPKFLFKTPVTIESHISKTEALFSAVDKDM